MTETPGVYNVGDRPLRPQPPPSFEAQLKALPPACDRLQSRWHSGTWNRKFVHD
jgi:hypothetical protein